MEDNDLAYCSEINQGAREQGTRLAVVPKRGSIKRELTPDHETLKRLTHRFSGYHWTILKIPRPIYAGESFFPSAYKQEMEHK
jgi:hypothetical protein